MKRILAVTLALLFSAQAAMAQTFVAPIGKNQSNFQSPANPQCVELDIGGSTFSSTNPIPVQPSQGNAAVSTTNPMSVTLTNGTATMPGLAANAANSIPVSNGNSTLACYQTSTAFQTPVATPTDIVGIIGSATKTVKIQRIVLHNAQTTAGINKIFLIVRSTADTGSTVVNPTVVPLDSNNAAGTAVVKQYTVTNPTPGATVGTIATIYALAPLPASTGAGGDVVLFDSKLTGQPIVLRGVAQELDINFAGAAVPTGWTVSVDHFWSEE